MASSRVVAFVMAGGAGERLRPFTAELPKPALPFAGGHRIIDFALSNLYNSAIRSVYVLLQYRPESLLEHLSQCWGFANGASGEFIEAVLPGRRGITCGFRGTADAVHQSLDLIAGSEADYVAVFAADHVYRMDVRQMIAFHEAADADATVAAIPVPIEEAPAFGVIETQADGRIRGFQEKPSAPAAMPGDPHRCLASMGNYLFRREVLCKALAAAVNRAGYDFGRHVLPRLVATHRVYAYNRASQVVPGTRPYEEPAYWRDVGTVEAYVAAHWDLLGPQPRFCLDNPQWPVLPHSGASVARPAKGVHHSIIGPNGSFAGASLQHSVLQRGACVDADARLEHCVIMSGARVKRGARLCRTIVGPGTTLEEGVAIGHDASTDRRRYNVTPSGIVVVPPPG